ncbi:MlaE family lipid ABC transporter permease subunit [Pseudomonas sp. NW5]|uniref:ABC transporter permease n=1 Tax=Pseudomonas sp. NW5 TaxID=2934934 RepID=UPI002020B254|nr:MlaE family lipid ABC transporter permease subunit [Pseudomonas sp. NW5]MCL7461110.1 MlaE family lipid ABC transporter permease subunit [Pseudomonas sp. NW5]
MQEASRPRAALCWAGEQDGVLHLALHGDWTLAASKPDLLSVWHSQASKPARLCVQLEALGQWDSSLLAVLRRLQRLAETHGHTLEYQALPEGVARLLQLASRPSTQVSEPLLVHQPLLVRLGWQVLQRQQALSQACIFIGEVLLGLGRLLRGRARMRGQDFAAALAQCGPGALPIVALIATLVGLILAFVGAAQLQAFGAQLYIANMVAIGMTREMGALMTAVIMAGRTGAAYAAELGSMQANEEIDALRTFGFPPLEFLVLPRLLALLVSMPILCVFADALGILGGFIIGAGLFDISAPLYLSQSLEMLTLTDFLLGLFKSLVFAVLIALIGCHYGLACGRNAQAVGQATTHAVVSIIVALVVSDALITLICTQLGI